MKQFLNQLLRKSNPRVGYFLISLMEIALGSWLFYPLFFGVPEGCSAVVHGISVLTGAHFMLLGGLTLTSIVIQNRALRFRTGVFHILLWAFLAAYSALGDTFALIIFTPAVFFTFVSIFFYAREQMTEGGEFR